MDKIIRISHGEEILDAPYALNQYSLHNSPLYSEKLGEMFPILIPFLHENF